MVWAGTWRDNFENGDLDGWQKWEWPGQNTGKIEERNGVLTVTDINSNFDTLIGNVWRKIERIKLPFTLVIGEWHNIKLNAEGTQIALWIDRKLVQQVDWRGHRADLPEVGEIQIGVAGGESQWDNFVLSADEVPDFGNSSVVPKDKLTTYWSCLKRPQYLLGYRRLSR